MKLFRKHVTLPLLLASIGLAVGCGGGSSAPTKAAFLTEADAICSKTDRAKVSRMQAAAHRTPVGKMSEAELTKMVIRVTMPPLEAEARELQELTPPEGDAAKIEAMVKGIEAAVEKAKADPESLAEESTNPFKKVNAEGKAYGFEACSEFS